jgi:hypothetical protein
MITELPRRMERVLISSAVLRHSRELLDPFRLRNVEGCLLWYGYVLDAETCLVTTCVRPAQSSQTEEYDISAESMGAVRQRVRPHRLLLIVQVHSHPARAFYSSWDEQHALNTRVGALNMVVPNFGNVRWIDPEQFCMVERNERGEWERWSPHDWDRLVTVPDALALS